MRKTLKGQEDDIKRRSYNRNCQWRICTSGQLLTLRKTGIGNQNSLMNYARFVQCFRTNKNSLKGQCSSVRTVLLVQRRRPRFARPPGLETIRRPGGQEAGYTESNFETSLRSYVTGRSGCKLFLKTHSKNQLTDTNIGHSLLVASLAEKFIAELLYFDGTKYCYTISQNIHFICMLLSPCLGNKFRA